MLALEYDGEQHRVDSAQYAYDIQRSEDLGELGWTGLRVVKQNRAADVLRRLDRAWRSKLRTDRDDLVKSRSVSSLGDSRRRTS